MVLSAVSATNAGSYDVIVNNAFRSVTSSVVTLNVVFYFQAPELNGSAVTFSWQTSPGVSYQIQYTTNLDSTNWTDLGAAIIATNGLTTASDNPAPDPQRFYRVIQQ